MKNLNKERQVFEVELTRDEVELIRQLTQNIPEEIKGLLGVSERTLYLGLFVGTSRLLGYDMCDDGTMSRTNG